MNQLLWEQDFRDEITSINTGDESITLNFQNNSSITFSTYHSRDCCESVYGDFSIAKYHESQLINKELRKVQVKSVSGMGFLLCFKVDYDDVKIFIPCYNYQNGYYSSNLELKIEHGENKTSVDIHGCIEHHIN